jgi:Tol biopolymer transport system component
MRKKLFLGSIALLSFAIAILVFEVSCSKVAVAQTNSMQLNKIVYLSKHGNGSEIWIANYDGTNKTKVTYSLPSGLILDFVYGVRMSPDGKKLFFSASTDGYGQTADGIYSCNVDGSNVTKIITSSNSTDSLHIGGAY